MVARTNRIAVVMGINERDTVYSRGTLYNSQLFISEEGEILGVHRKLLPTHAERILWGQGDGSTLHVFDTPLGPRRWAGLLGALDAAHALRNARKRGADPRCRVARSA